MKETNRSRNWKRIAMTVICVILALILLAMIFVSAYAIRLLNLIGRYDEDDPQILTPEQVATLTEPEDSMDPDYTGPILDPGDITFPTAPEQPVEPQRELVNILLIGQDRRPGEPRQRSDSMILCTFDKERNCVTMTSFMRDMWVDIPGYQPAKINAAYAWGGMPLLTQTLAANFGVHVDACVEVDFGGFQKIIDLLGGVDVTLTEAEVRYFHDGCGYEYVVGLNHLNGEQALAYSRLREIGTDFGRTQRQRNVMTAIFNECRNQSFTQLMTLLEEILPLITTDMTNSEIIGYATDLFPLLSGGTLQTLRIPADGMYEGGWVSKQSVLLVDFEATRQLIYETLMR